MTNRSAVVPFFEKSNDAATIRPHERKKIMERLGVAIIGLNGAVSSTLVAGVKLMTKGLVPRVGMLTEKEGPTAPSELTELLQFAPLEGLVFGGWDLNDASLYAAAQHHKVLPVHQLDQVRDELDAIKPWKAVFARSYAENIDGEHVVAPSGYREHIEAVRGDILKFKKDNNLDRVVMVNLSSTEKWIDTEAVHETLAAFEAGLDADDPAISPAMRYFYAANSLGIPHVNFAPSLANIPALREQADKHGVPYTGMDGKTGQTLVKTAMASMFRARRLQIAGWYSINFLGNNDGLVLDAPASNKTKIMSKASVLDSIVGHKVENHQVHIHYYKPRGDAKEAWDNIDIVGFGGVPMQMKINFLCQDSILAAPLVVDLVRLLDVAHQKGAKGIQHQLSIFFKSPYHEVGAQPEHDLFKQENMLLEWARGAAGSHATSVRVAAGNGNGNGKAKVTQHEPERPAQRIA